MQANDGTTDAGHAEQRDGASQDQIDVALLDDAIEEALTWCRAPGAS